MVDHQVDVDQRVDRGRVTADLFHGVTHRGEVDHGRHAGEVLHQDPGGLEGDLDRWFGGGVPGRDRFDVPGAHRDAVLEAQHVLQQDLHRIRQAGDVELGLEGVEAVDLVALAANVEGVSCSV